MIRAATLADVEDLASVHVQSWIDAYTGLLPAETIAGMSIDVRRDMWSRRLNRSVEDVWVAESDGAVVGLASIGPAQDPPGWGHLYNIYLVASAWGRGLGSGLWEAAMSGFDGMGLADRQLYVLDTNERARKFYEWKGWRHDGTVIMDDSFGEPIREVRYVSG